MEIKKIDENTPKDRPIIVWYDHDADPYTDPENPNKLTDYAANAESGDYCCGSGFAVVKWAEQFFETEDEYGSGYWVPGCWIAWINNDYCDSAVNAIYWVDVGEWKPEEVAA